MVLPHFLWISFRGEDQPDQMEDPESRQRCGVSQKCIERNLLADIPFIQNKKSILTCLSIRYDSSFTNSVIVSSDFIARLYSPFSAMVKFELSP